MAFKIVKKKYFYLLNLEIFFINKQVKPTIKQNIAALTLLS